MGTAYGVLDINHGGLLLAERLRGMGYDAFAVDVYGTRRDVSAGVPVLKPDEVKGFDALAAPVHMPPIPLLQRAYAEQKAVYTHHELTGLIIRQTGLLNCKCIEVTGTYGKTTTCAILARMFPREDVLLHNSMGLFFNGERLGRLSITPANIIKALEVAAEKKPTLCIFEVSLGLCGIGDVSVITTLDRDYPIAGGSLMASDAKLRAIKGLKQGGVLVCDASIKENVKRLTFGRGGDVFYAPDGRVRYRLPDKDGWVRIRFSGGFDGASYRGPALCAIATALAMGASPEDIAGAFEGFEGVEGRMKFSTLQGRVLLDNSNSGLNIKGVERALDAVEEDEGWKVLVIGEEAYNVCDGLDPAKVSEILGDPRVDEAILVGDRMRIGGHAHAGSLEEGLAMALEKTSPGDTIISCVKTWR
ncbi:coenzyme F430 synthase [Methanocella conradii]|uniref:coenzyme F430 synthase n=1 Tax=Methanocella conradii TaxID=1175444 RepID=UPI00157D3486|nr:coenzyme F430 synthase [Methanocella conradii]